METTLQIKNIDVKGFGNIGHVVMRELGDRIILEGVNGVGKTMILTAVRAALEGKTSLPDRPLAEWIKDGHESAVIKIDLADGSVIKFSIRVIITSDNFDLQIKEVFENGKSKKVPGGPMAFLKTIVNAIAFRPQQWRKKSDKEQCEEVFNFFPGLKDKLENNSKEISEVEGERNDFLGKCKVLRLDIERTPFTPGLPEKEVDPATLVEKLNVAKEHNAQIDEMKRDVGKATERLSQIDEDMRSAAAGIQRTEEMIQNLQQQLEDSKANLDEKRKIRIETEKTISSLNASIETFDIHPIENIEHEISEVNQKNESIRNNAELKRLQNELESKELKATELYSKIVTIKKKRTEIMSSVEIPIDGLSIGEGCLLYPNSQMEMVRLSALSDGEFWPVACGLIAAFKPKVRIMIIDNFWDLDKANFEALCNAAKQYKMQPWIHKTLQEESDASIGFLIRDGEVVTENR